MFIFFMVTAIIRLSRQSVLTTTKTVFLQATSSHSYQSITNLDLRILYAILSPKNPIKRYNNNSVIKVSIHRKAHIKSYLVVLNLTKWYIVNLSWLLESSFMKPSHKTVIVILFVDGFFDKPTSE